MTLLRFKLLEVGDVFTVDNIPYKKADAKRKSCCTPKSNAVRQESPKPVWFEDSQPVEVIDAALLFDDEEV